MASLPATSFAKIDMSLDDIIKLNKKEKKAEAAAKKKSTESVKRLTPAQRRRANALKANAKRMQSNKGQTSKKSARNLSKNSNNAGGKGAFARKTKPAMLKTGNANAPKKNQVPGQKSPRGGGAQKIARQRNRGAASSQVTLGLRIRTAQTNQKNKRQQVTNQRRRGLQTNPGNRNRPRGNRRGQVTNASQQRIQNRRYNQQPRRQYGQQTKGRGPGRQQRGRGGRRGRGRTVTLH